MFRELSSGLVSQLSSEQDLSYPERRVDLEEGGGLRALDLLSKSLPFPFSSKEVAMKLPTCSAKVDEPPTSFRSYSSSSSSAPACSAPSLSCLYLEGIRLSWSSALFVKPLFLWA